MGYNENMKFQDLIIGGGASGITTAILLAGKGRKVAVAEAQDRVLKKVLASGNGRCNLSNVRVSPQKYNAPEFVAPALSAFGTHEAERFFVELGVKLRTEDDRIYPYSMSANNVVNALLRATEKAGAELFARTKVEEIEKTGTGFEVRAEGRSFQCLNLIFATGSNATSGRDSLSLLSHFGHTVTQRYAAVSAIPCRSVKGAGGVRAKARLRLYSGDKTVFDGEGELLFKDDSLSGILAFEASSYYARELRHGRKCSGSIDFVPDAGEDETAEFFKKSDCDCTEALTAYLHRALAASVAKKAGVKGSARDNARRLARVLKDYQCEFDGVAEIKNAQVVCGGLNLEEFDPVTLASLKTSGLYATGEALDVDGDCGGFNLHWAWASAHAASRAITGVKDVQA